MLSVAFTSSLVIPGSYIECPAPFTIRSFISGHALCKSYAVPGGHIKSAAPCTAIQGMSRIRFMRSSCSRKPSSMKAPFAEYKQVSIACAGIASVLDVFGEPDELLVAETFASLVPFTSLADEPWEFSILFARVPTEVLSSDPDSLTSAVEFSSVAFTSDSFCSFCSIIRCIIRARACRCASSSCTPSTFHAVPFHSKTLPPTPVSLPSRLARLSPKMLNSQVDQALAAAFRTVAFPLKKRSR
mmetsp:Transcript_26609/g.54206  ORF Transcript_26609/g.54206 Transcript_26609/m.54206 type:complete len:243 (+) Transcript_26609:2926-3654(+)